MENENNNHEIEYSESPHGETDSSPQMIIIDHGASTRGTDTRGAQDRDEERREKASNVHITFGSFGSDGLNFNGQPLRNVKLDWKTRLTVMAIGAVVFVVVVSLAISAALILLLAAAVGAAVYGVSRLMNAIQRR